MLRAGVRSSQITHIAITHRHGDHTLGLPGVLQRMALDQRSQPISLVYPDHAKPYLDRLLGVDLFDREIDVRDMPLPTDVPSDVDLGSGMRLLTEPLDHRVPTLGYRVQEPDGRSMSQDALDRHGLEGPIVGQLLREGSVTRNGQMIQLDDVSDPRCGQAFAFVMDTRRCPAIGRLCRGCDLAVIESTYRDGDEDLAQRYGHLTAAQSGAEAAAAGVRLLVLAHYSQRYGEVEGFAAQARTHHAEVVAAEDLMTIGVPSRATVRESC